MAAGNAIWGATEREGERKKEEKTGERDANVNADEQVTYL